MFDLVDEPEDPDFITHPDVVEEEIPYDYMVKLRIAAQLELEKMKKDYPARFFIPNIGQEKSVEPYRIHNGTELGVPFINVFGGGNGVGKTSQLVIFAVGLAWGFDEINEFFKDYYVFQRMADRRKDQRRPTAIRIVCNSDSMKENGALHSEIVKWFPKGRYSMVKAGKTFYSQIKCFAEDGETVICDIDIKSHEQSMIAMSGSNLDVILFDEPPPEQHYAESVGRLRGGGFMAFFLTPLEMSAFLYSQVIEDLDGITKVMTQASLWDNCADIPGTRGHLKKSMIDQLISEWRRVNPLEVEARVNGTFQHLAGAIYKIFSPHAHTMPQFKLPDEFLLHFVIDPHDSRPPACQWIAQSPTISYVVAEWPSEEYTQMTTTTLTISDFCDAIREVERQLGRVADVRLCDPNKLNYPYPNTRMTVAQEYERFGIELEASDDNMEIGHMRVNELLHYNPEQELSAYNMPRLRVFDHCQNTINSLKGYAFKKNANMGSANMNSKLDQKYKDFADCTRYWAIKLGPYVPPKQFGQSFITDIFGGR